MKQAIKIGFFILLYGFTANSTYAQWYTTYYWPKQELEKRYRQATTNKERIEILIALHRYSEAHDSVGSRMTQYADSTLLAVAENSEDPNLILLAKHARIRSNSLGMTDSDKLNHLKNLFVYARNKGLYGWMAILKASEARYMSMPSYKISDVENTFEQAIEWAEKDRARDSTLTLVYLNWSAYYSNQTEIVKGLRKVYKAIDHARKINNNDLLYQANGELAGYYNSLNKPEEAEQITREMIRFAERAPNRQYSVLLSYAYLARLQIIKEEWQLAKITIGKVFRMADSLNVSPAGRANLIGSIGGAMKNRENPEFLRWFMSKYLGSFFQTPLVAFLDNYFVAGLYLRTGNKDSARHYLNKASLLFSTALNNAQRGDYYETCMLTEMAFKNPNKAKLYADSALSMALRAKRLKKAILFTDSLRNFYIREKNIDELIRYTAMKDSLTLELERATSAELLAAEEGNALERERAFLAEQAAKETQSRHNLQLLAISIGIILVFIILAMLGAFKVSANTIRIVGFFSFLLFFEFIFLVFKKKIYVITKGEPWMDLAFMIALAAVLVPLHHWLEHRVVHYLSHKRPGSYLIRRSKDTPINQGNQL